MFCYKILRGHVAGPPENYGLFLSLRQLRGHSLKLVVNHVRVDIRKHYFGCRVCEPWNSLPESVVNIASVKSFKRALSYCDFATFLVFND